MLLSEVSGNREAEGRKMNIQGSGVVAAGLEVWESPKTPPVETR